MGCHCERSEARQWAVIAGGAKQGNRQE